MMKTEDNGRISIPLPVGLDHVESEDIEDVQVPLENQGFIYVPITEPKKGQKKESHVCIFADCKRGKRGGTEFCNKHKKMGLVEREKLATKKSIEKQSQKFVDKNIEGLNADLDNPKAKFVASLNKEGPVAAGETVYTIQTVYPKNISITGLVLVLISFLQLTLGFEQNEDMCFISLLFFIIGTAFLVIDSPSKLRSFTYFLVVVIAYNIHFAILFESNFSMGAGGAGLGGLSEWGGP